MEGEKYYQFTNIFANLFHLRGYEVLSEHVADPQLEKIESSMTEQEIFARDMDQLENSVCLIAEVSIPSIGVGYEVCSAVPKGHPSNMSLQVRFQCVGYDFG